MLKTIFAVAVVFVGLSLLFSLVAKVESNKEVITEFNTLPLPNPNSLTKVNEAIRRWDLCRTSHFYRMTAEEKECRSFITKFNALSEQEQEYFVSRIAPDKRPIGVVKQSGTPAVAFQSNRTLEQFKELAQNSYK